MKKLPLVPPESGTASEASLQSQKFFSEAFRRTKWFVLLFLVLFVLLMLLFRGDQINYENFMFLVRDLDAEYNAEIDEAGIGVTYDVDSDMVCQVFKNHLVMIDTSQVNLYGLSGYGVFSYPHEYRLPCITASENYFIVYDLGGYRFSVYNAVGCLYESKPCEYPITDAYIADNGTFCIVTGNQTYCSTVQVYNDRFSLLASYNTMRYVTKAMLSRDAKSLLMASTYVKSGVSRVVLQSYRLGEEDYDFRVEYPEATEMNGLLNSVIPLNVSYFYDHGSAVLCDTGVMFCSSDGDWNKFYSYADNLSADVGALSLAAYGQDQMALLFVDKVNDGLMHLWVLDEEGNPLYDSGSTITVNDRILAADYDGNTLFLLSATHAYRMEKSGKLSSTMLTQSGEFLSFSAYRANTAIVSYKDKTVAVRFD